MQIYFNEKNQLFFDGYDTGKYVEEAWGNTDYEYIYSIEPKEVNKFYPIFNLTVGDKSALLQAIKKNLVLTMLTHYLENLCLLIILIMSVLHGPDRI